MNEEKLMHVKPSFYSYCFEYLKVEALKFGYNLVLHGSLTRDMDLIAIPWTTEANSADVPFMIGAFAEILEAQPIPMTEKQRKCFPHGRESYLLNMCRSGYDSENNYYKDKGFYLDISVIPTKE